VHTDFVAPSGDVVDDLVARALRDAGEQASRSDWRRVEHGSANLVVLAGRVAVRVARTPVAASDTLRAQWLIDALPPLPFAVPRALGGAVGGPDTGGIIAIAQERIDGEVHPSGSGDPRELRRLLDALRAVDLAPLRPHLAHRHAFFGGEDGLRVMIEQAVPLLDPAARGAARRAAEEFAALAAAPDVLTHGDLAGSNVLWAAGHGSVSGVIDWDLAAADDESKDVAALATWHGGDAVASIVPPETAYRARVRIATYPLQLLCFALVGSRPPSEIARAVTRANEKYAG